MMKIVIKNVDAIVRKLVQVSTRLTKNRLEAAKKKRQKKEVVKKRQKIKTITAKPHIVRGRMSLSSEKKDKGDNGNSINLDLAKNK